MKNEAIEKKEQMSLAPTVQAGALGIQGLEDYDASVLPVPFVRLVQAQSKDVEMANNKEAPAGTFYFNDTRESMETLEFVILKSKPVTVDFERDGQIKKTPLRKILGMTLSDKRVFILTISVASFLNFGRLISLMRLRGVHAVWERSVTAKAVKTENDKGKFYVIEFSLGEPLKEEEKEEMALAFEEWKLVLDRKGETEITHDEDQIA